MQKKNNSELDEPHTRMINPVLEALYSWDFNATEYKVMLFVIRKTWGFHKTEDSIAISQIIKGVHKSRRGIIEAIDSLVQKNALVQKGAQGIMSVLAIQKNTSLWVPVQNIAQVRKTAPVQKTAGTRATLRKKPVQKTAHTKDNTKEILQKKSITNVIEGEPKKDVNYFIGLFKDVNINYTILYPRAPQRQAVEKMLKNSELGPEKLEWLILHLKETNTREFYPTITTPVQLQEKLASLLVQLRKERTKKENGKKRVLNL